MTYVTIAQSFLYGILLGMLTCNIFIVESNVFVRQALALRLQKSTCISLVGSTDAPPNDTIFYEAKPDIIVYGLPNRTQRPKAFIKKMIHRMSLIAPTIVLAHYVIEEEKQQYLGAGAKQYLLKQLDSQKLFTAICAAKSSH